MLLGSKMAREGQQINSMRDLIVVTLSASTEGLRFISAEEVEARSFEQLNPELLALWVQFLPLAFFLGLPFKFGAAINHS